jgi:hypothetical protein
MLFISGLQNDDKKSHTKVRRPDDSSLDVPNDAGETDIEIALKKVSSSNHKTSVFICLYMSSSKPTGRRACPCVKRNRNIESTTQRFMVLLLPCLLLRKEKTFHCRLRRCHLSHLLQLLCLLQIRVLTGGRSHFHPSYLVLPLHMPPLGDHRDARIFFGNFSIAVIERCLAESCTASSSFICHHTM